MYHDACCSHQGSAHFEQCHATTTTIKQHHTTTVNQCHRSAWYLYIVLFFFLDCCWWPVPVLGHTWTDMYPGCIHSGHVSPSDSTLCTFVSLQAVPLHPAHFTWWAVVWGVGSKDTQLVCLGWWVHADCHQHNVEHSNNGSTTSTTNQTYTTLCCWRIPCTGTQCISVPPVTTLLLHIVNKKICRPKKACKYSKKCPLFISVPCSYEGEIKKLVGQGSWSATSLWINTMHPEPRKAACERAMITEWDFCLAQLQYKKKNNHK